jgi:outer membrane protein assembly factor BamB
MKSFPDARSTPTVVGDRAYVISGMGEIACVETTSGHVVWSVDGMSAFGGRPGPWGTAESPLVIGDKLIYTPGGSKTAVVALDRRSGRTIWQTKSLDDQGGYVSPIAIDVAGRTQVVALTGNYVLGVDAASGTIDWRVRFGDIGVTEDGGDITTNTPIHRAARIFITSGYNHAGVQLRLTPDGRGAAIEWVQPALDNHHGHVVLVGDHLYGSNWINNNKGNWVALDWQSGKPAYEAQWQTKGPVIAAEGMLYCYDERQGNLALVRATPSGFDISSSFRVSAGDGPHWAHPAISDGRLYVRHGDALLAYDIKAGQRAAR